MASGNGGTGGGLRLLSQVLIVLLAVMIFAAAGRIAYVCGYSVFHEQAAEDPPGRDIEITIPPGTGTTGIASILRDGGLIDAVWLFVVQERLSAWHGKLQPGTYRLNTSMKPSEIMQVMAGEAASE